MANLDKTFVRDLKAKDHMQMFFIVKEKNSGTDRNGKPFLSVTIADKSGHINARMFDNVDAVKGEFEIGDVVWVKGFVQLYQGRKQIVINEMRKASEGEFNLSDVVAELGGDSKEHYAQLLKIVGEMQDAFVRELMLNTLNDEEIKTLLIKAPAAKTIHHAYRGGLIEHIHSIVKVMLSLSEHYKYLNRDLLIFGAIFHDLGKIFELDLEGGIKYSQRGRLVGHMVLACEIIDQKAAAVKDFPQDTLDVLKHIVLSHHGKLEYGSPKLPMIPEAIVVAMIDDLDSKMNTLFHFLRNEVETLPAGEKWTHFHPGFERYFFLDYFRKQTT